ncbi:MAG: hypothetical protein WAW02_06700 [Sideroxyarcus sp.]
MTANTNDPRVELNKISKLLIEDLFSMSDAELLQDATKDKSLKESGNLVENAYQKAIQSVGAKKLQTARAEMKAAQAQTSLDAGSIDANAARKVIAKLTAANDATLTLAARNLKNISDEDAIELVKELVELGAIKKDEQF